MNQTWLDALPKRLADQFKFIDEIDRLKNVIRATQNLHNERRENTAEHSWHVALMGLVLAEHANEPVDARTVALMLLIHDLVEIDAGDHPLHGGHPPEDQAAKEQAAADRLFGLLPADQRDTWRELWETFEAAQTPEAKFAKAVDRFQPLLCNMANGGGSWIDYNVSRTEMETRVASKIEPGSKALLEASRAIFDAATEQGWLRE